MSMQLKICGVTTLEDARYCAAKGADYLGFIQYEKSERYITPKKAAEIIGWVYGPQPVGVFVNATAEVVNRTAEEAGFQLVQLHGDEPAFEVASIEVPVIKALRVAPDTSGESLRRAFREYEDVVDYFLLDTYSAAMRGGTGETFDWDVARELVAEYPTFLAGGLSASNIAAAINALQPFGVDLSSSLETTPGAKDFGKVDTFIEAFEEARSSNEVKQ